MKKPYIFKIMATQVIFGLFLLLYSCSDDEGGLEPATISFAEESYTIAENNPNGANVTVDFSQSALLEGDFSVTIASEDGTYGTDFTTKPAMEDGSVNFTVKVAENQKSIIVRPVDNEAFTGDFTVFLTLTPGQNTILGERATTEVIITDNEFETTTIAGLRAMHTGSDITIEESTIIQGVVTSSIDAVGEDYLVVQDATGGIAMRLGDTHDFTPGNTLRFNLNGGTIASSNGLLEITGINKSNAAVINEESELPEVRQITLEELSTGNFQGQLVKVSDISFTEADGELTFSGVQTISDGEKEAGVRTQSFAPFADDVLPQGSGDVAGIAGNNEIWPQAREDVFND